MSVEAELTDEIKKWSKKLDDSLLNVHALDDRGAKMLENIRAYRKDSKHFLEQDNLVKSFECLIWAWALLEVGKELKHIG
jgi:hypothetical protein